MKCIFLGCMSGISKKTNEPYHVVWYGVPTSFTNAKGYTPATLYDTKEHIIFDKLSTLNPLDTFEGFITYHRGEYLLTNVE